MPRSILVRHGVAGAAVGFILIIKAPLESLVGTGPPLILFIPALTFSAWFGGFGPGLLATALSVLSCNYLYFPPIGSFKVDSGYDQIQLGVFVLEGILTSSLMQQLLDARRQSETSATKAEEYRDTLQESEVRLQAILDHSTALIYPFFEQVTGRRPDRVRGTNWFATFVAPEDQPEARAAFERALSVAEGSQVIHRIVARGGDCASSNGPTGRSPDPRAKSSPSAMTSPS